VAWGKRGEKAAAATVEPAPEATPPAGDVVTAQMDPVERLARSEQKIRELTGQIEELTFQLHQTQEQLQRLQADSDLRLQQLEGGAKKGTAPVAAKPETSEGSVLVIAKQPSEPVASAPAPEPVPGEAPQTLGTLATDAPAAVHDQPIDLTAPMPAAPAETGGATVAMLGEPKADYERAYASILSGDYAGAEASFRQFIATYPGDERAPDAQYWLGESLFARGEYGDAADEFLSAYKAYPKSGKAPDTLLKLGLSLAGLGEREAACSTYAEVLKKYPQASKALRQRVQNEQALAAC
jgi:tol-pal system protein YbgF